MPPATTPAPNAPSYPLFIGGRFVAGASLVLIAGQVVLADITPANRGRTMAIYQGVFLFESAWARCQVACWPSA